MTKHFIVTQGIFAVLALFCTRGLHAQRIRVKLSAVDSTYQNNSGDSSRIFHASLYALTGTAPAGFTLVAQTWGAGAQQWLTNKDTSFSMTSAQLCGSGNTPYTVCRMGTKMLRLNLGRLHYNTRRRFTLLIPSGQGAIITHELTF